MSVISTATKARMGGKAAKTMAKNPGAMLTLGKAGAKAAGPMAKLGAKAGPPMTKLSMKAGKPLAKRRARRRVEKLSEAVRSAAEELATYGPQAAQELGLVEPPKRRRTAPRVAAGVVLGAATMYFLEPEHGKEHREKVAHMVS